MKNIYLIETKEPTANILLVKDNGEIQIFDKSFYDMWKFHQQFGDFAPSNAVYKNIYITSDEEIKEGDWFILDMSHSSHSNELHQLGDDKWSKTGGIHFCEGNSWVDSCKKIILTTDQDLIKDGVQPIDDEFLQWFVQNPNCEEVEVERCPIEGRYSIDLRKYIQKEEPKQETLEEAAENYAVQFLLEDEQETDSANRKQAFKEGAKWMQERMYSEEDMRLAIKKARDISDGKDCFDAEDISGCTEVCTYSWRFNMSEDSIIEQFKK